MALSAVAADVDVVVVNWNSGDDLRVLLGDLDGQDLALRVVVVDNGSSDGSADNLPPQVHLVPTGENLGYAGGTNLGLGLRTPGRPVMLCNPDVRLPDRSSVRTLVRELAGRPEVAAVAPVLRYEEGAPLEYWGARIRLRSASVTKAFFNELATAPAGNVRCDWLDGAVWLLRDEAVLGVGLLDERYFLYFEETEWCVRARERGWSLLLVDTEVLHRRGSSFGTSPKGSYYYWRNLPLLVTSHGPRWAVLVIAARLLVMHRREVDPVRRRQARTGFADFLRGSFGPGPQDRAGTATGSATNANCR